MSVEYWSLRQEMYDFRSSIDFVFKIPYYHVLKTREQKTLLNAVT
jgi:hypothetical protein